MCLAPKFWNGTSTEPRIKLAVTMHPRQNRTLTHASTFKHMSLPMTSLSMCLPLLTKTTRLQNVAHVCTLSSPRRTSTTCPTTECASTSAVMPTYCSSLQDHMDASLHPIIARCRPKSPLGRLYLASATLCSPPIFLHFLSNPYPQLYHTYMWRLPLTPTVRHATCTR